MGATHVDVWQDTWLLELNTAPPRGANAYQLGYDATDEIPELVQVVHHASRLDKQIFIRQRAPMNVINGNPSSGTYSGIRKATLGPDPSNPGYNTGNESFFEIANPGVGMVVEGASGAALTDPNQRLIGVLSGGAGCYSAVSYRFGPAWSRTYHTYFPDQVLDGRPATAPAAPVPTVELTAPATAANNASITLSWSATDASSCVAGGTWTGTRGISGSEVVTVTNPNPAGGTAVNRSFTLTCTGEGGNGMAETTVSVQATPATGGGTGGTTGGAGTPSGGGAFGWLGLVLGGLAAWVRRCRRQRR